MILLLQSLLEQQPYALYWIKIRRLSRVRVEDDMVSSPDVIRGVVAAAVAIRRVTVF